MRRELTDDQTALRENAGNVIAVNLALGCPQPLIPSGNLNRPEAETARPTRDTGQLIEGGTCIAELRQIDAWTFDRLHGVPLFVD